MIKNLNFTTLNNAIVLVLLGIAALFLFHNENITNRLKSAVNIVAELQPKSSLNDINVLVEQLKNNYKINAASVEFVPKEDALKSMDQLTQDGVLGLDTLNPFRDAVIFSLNAEAYNDEFLKELSDQIKTLPFVSNVYYQQDVFEIIQRNISRVTWVSLFVAGLFLLITISLIYNTVRLSLARDDQKISTMSLVGASTSYIKRPYYRDAVIQGLMSALLAIIVLILLSLFLYNQVSIISNILSPAKVIVAIVILCFLGFLIPTVATRFVIKKFFDRIYT